MGNITAKDLLEGLAKHYYTKNKVKKCCYYCRHYNASLRSTCDNSKAPAFKLNISNPLNAWCLEIETNESVFDKETNPED